jgi:hypothetical protein
LGCLHFFLIEGKRHMGYLNEDRVNATFSDLFFKPEELVNGKPIVECTIVKCRDGNLGFHSGRVEKNREIIEKLLLGLSDIFFEAGGGAFRSLYHDAEGHKWASSFLTLEKLVYLGLAAGYIEYVADDVSKYPKIKVINPLIVDVQTVD